MNTKTAAVLLFAAIAAGCATLKPDIERASREGVSFTASPTDKNVLVWRSPDARPTTRYTIEPVRWSPGADADIPEDEKAAIETAFRKSIEAAMSGATSAPAADEPSVVIRPTITAVDKSNPVANTALSILTIGPADTGGAAAELLVEDAASGKLLAAVVASSNGGMFSTKGFRKWGHAEQGLKRISEELATLLGD